MSENMDAKVEALLCDFFAHETPATLPKEEPSVAFNSPLLAQPNAERPLQKTLWCLGGAATLAAAMAIALWVRGGWQNQHGDWEPPLLAENGKAEPTTDEYRQFDIVRPVRPTELVYHSSWEEIGGRPIRVAVTDGAELLDVRSFPADDGQYQQRTLVDWTSVRLLEPTTGDWVEATVPKLRIELTKLKSQ